MDTFIKELKLEEIPDGPWKQVAEQIGVENLYTVLRIVGGGTTYIPKAETLIRPSGTGTSGKSSTGATIWSWQRSTM